MGESLQKSEIKAEIKPREMKEERPMSVRLVSLLVFRSFSLSVFLAEAVTMRSPAFACHPSTARSDSARWELRAKSRELKKNLLRPGESFHT